MAETHDVKDSNVMGDINVTPLVDVMLVLLIIFMIVTPALVAGFNAILPTGENLKERPDEEDRTTLGIDAAGEWYINKVRIRKEDAMALLQADFQKHPEDRVLFVRADRSLKYGQLMEAMDIAKRAGARVVAAVTEKAGDDEEEGGSR
jgi:biopolymer transport protein ExbD